MDRIATRESLLKLSTDLILFFLAGQIFGAADIAKIGRGMCSEGPRRCDGVQENSDILSDYPRPDYRVSDYPPPDQRVSERRLPGGRMSVSPLSDSRLSTSSGLSTSLSDSALSWAMVAYTFLLALFAIFQFFSSQGLIYWRVKSPGWTFGPYVNHNHYAGLMEMLIPLAVAGALPALRRRAPAVVVGAAVLIPVASLLLAGSRGGFLSLLAEILLAAVLVLGWGPRHARRATALAGGAALLAAALLFFWMAPRHVAERLATLADHTPPSEAEREHRWFAARDALRILVDHPALGAGLGSFETVFPRYQSFPSDFRWDYAHNDYAQALAETGAAGGATILAALGMFFWLAFGNLRERLRQPAGWIPFAAALGCCGLLVHSSVDFNLHIPANAAWFAVCVALATGQGARVTGQGIRGKAKGTRDTGALEA
jgi:O-antigen ligase